MMCEKTTKSENPLFRKALSFFIKDKNMVNLPYLKKIIRGKIHFGQKILRKG